MVCENPTFGSYRGMLWVVSTCLRYSGLSFSSGDRRRRVLCHASVPPTQKDGTPRTPYNTSIHSLLQRALHHEREPFRLHLMISQLTNRSRPNSHNFSRTANRSPTLPSPPIPHRLLHPHPSPPAVRVLVSPRNQDWQVCRLTHRRWVQEDTPME